MKYGYLIILSIIIITTVSSCGGTIGNIERYKFYNISSESMKVAVRRVKFKHPEFCRYDSVKFDEAKSKTMGVQEYYCTITQENKKFFFIYAFIDYVEPNIKATEIVLQTAAPYGKVLYLASNIGFFEQIKYEKLFRSNFIKAVRIELNYTKSNK